MHLSAIDICMDMRKLVGQNVQRIRKEKQLTQEQLAERTGFSQQYLSDLERGLRNPTVITLFEISVALGVSHIDLVAIWDDSNSDLILKK